MRAKTFLAFLAVLVLLAVMLVTQHDMEPHGVGWIALGLLAVGALRLSSEI